MRVIAGTYRSRTLHTLRGAALRPSSDRLRETLFNILSPEIQDAVFVDVFAGSGAVGIEALSRGAAHTIFIENHTAAAAVLRRNLQSLGIALETPATNKKGVAKEKLRFAGTAELFGVHAGLALDRLEARGVRADIVFADPPYADSKAYDAVLEILGEGELLARSGLAILEHSRRRELPGVAGQLERTRTVQQGDSTLSFYRRVLAA